jgi:hypothetical protein
VVAPFAPHGVSVEGRFRQLAPPPLVTPGMTVPPPSPLAPTPNDTVLPPRPPDDDVDAFALPVPAPGSTTTLPPHATTRPVATSDTAMADDLDALRMSARIVAGSEVTKP